MNREYAVKSGICGIAIIFGILCAIYGTRVEQYFHNAHVERQRYWDSAFRGDSASGDKCDYHEALKSKNVVYVFVK